MTVDIYFLGPTVWATKERTDKICYPTKQFWIGGGGESPMLPMVTLSYIWVSCKVGLLRRWSPHFLSFQDPHVITAEMQSICFSFTWTSPTQSYVTKHRRANFEAIQMFTQVSSGCKHETAVDRLYTNPYLAPMSSSCFSASNSLICDSKETQSYHASLP